MYPRFAFTLLFSICAFGLGSVYSEDICGPHAVYNACGSACHPTCARPQRSGVCTMQCVSGCFCVDGYLKNAQGRCVLRKDCDPRPGHEILTQLATRPSVPTCPKNEVFNGCGSRCAPTCANPNPKPICTRECVVGCFCKRGFLRNSRGMCVPANMCEASEGPVTVMPPPFEHLCAQNEEYRQCKGCDGTCRNPNPVCAQVCTPGCACKQGHVRSEINGRCIPTHQCASERQKRDAPIGIPDKPKCGAHEVYNDCGTACQATCARPQPEICTTQCVPGCFCERGHLRDDGGRCVPAAECDAKSTTIGPPLHRAPLGRHRCKSDREIYVSVCGNVYDCVYRCDAPVPYMFQGVPMMESRCLTGQCVGSCVCKHPYLRNEDGRCVEQKECEPAAGVRTSTTTTAATSTTTTPQ